MPILAGLLTGVVAAAPVLYAERVLVRDQASLTFGRALACGLAPFMLLQVLLVGVRLSVPAAAVSFGVTAALTFLLGATLAAVHAWQHLR